jgi:hypothetical protein
MSWKRVVELALRDSGFNADVAELAIQKLIEEEAVVAQEQPADSGIKPETTTRYVVEHRPPFGEYVPVGALTYTIHDARDERDAQADTVPRDRLRIVRVTETREVVE